MEKLSVAIAQMQVSDNVDANLKKVSEFCADAAKSGCEILALPEGFYHMGKSAKEKLAVLEDFGSGKIQDYIKELCVKHSIAILAGTLPIKSPETNKMYARACFYSSKAEVLSTYDKIHLFDAKLANGESFYESDFTFPGDKIEVFEYMGIKVGISICFDIRFSELYLEQKRQGVQLMLIPSAFSYPTGKAHVPYVEQEQLSHYVMLWHRIRLALSQVVRMLLVIH